MNATPIFRSSSWRASTALAWFTSGSPRFPIAASTAGLVTALNLARRTAGLRPFTGRITGTHASITSKHMFSPSRSQSSHKMSRAAPRASRSRCSTTREPRDASVFTTGASKSEAGSTSQLWKRAGKSMDRTCPVTAVTLKSHSTPSCRRANSCTSRVPRLVTCFPSDRKEAMESASEGFSATHITRGRRSRSSIATGTGRPRSAADVRRARTLSSAEGASLKFNAPVGRATRRGVK